MIDKLSKNLDHYKSLSETTKDQNEKLLSLNNQLNIRIQNLRMNVDGKAN
jgi:hypothetical protein